MAKEKKVAVKLTDPVVYTTIDDMDPEERRKLEADAAAKVKAEKDADARKKLEQDAAAVTFKPETHAAQVIAVRDDGTVDLIVHGPESDYRRRGVRFFDGAPGAREAAGCWTTPAAAELI